MDKSEAKYDIDRRDLKKWIFGLSIALFLLLLGILLPHIFSRTVTYESEFEGKIILTENNHGDFHVFLADNSLVFPDKSSFLEKHMKSGIEIKKEKNSNIIKISNSDSTYQLKLIFK